MKANSRLLSGIFILAVYFISCYPETKILGRYPNGKLKAVRHYKRGDSLNERYVYYYDNGQKQYVRYWRNDLMQVYKIKAWYKNGARRGEARMKEKDTVRKYSRSDSEYTFTGLYKQYAKGWYENGKLKFEIVTKDNLQIINYYDERGLRTKQEVVKVIRPDGYDTIAFKIEMYPNGKSYTEQLRWDAAHNFLLDE